MNPLFDEDRKMLTKFLEEEWQPIIASSSEGRWIDPNRSFATGNDMLDLKEKLVENGKWGEFYKWVDEVVYISSDAYNGCGYSEAELSNWLFTMPRFAELVDEFLKERREHDDRM